MRCTAIAGVPIIQHAIKSSCNGAAVHLMAVAVTGEGSPDGAWHPYRKATVLGIRLWYSP